MSKTRGMRESTILLAENFALNTVNGLAEVVTDDLNNTY
jgi:hypothetical protein